MQSTAPKVVALTTTSALRYTALLPVSLLRGGMAKDHGAPLTGQPPKQRRSSFFKEDVCAKKIGQDSYLRVHKKTKGWLKQRVMPS